MQGCSVIINLNTYQMLLYLPNFSTQITLYMFVYVCETKTEIEKTFRIIFLP